MTALDMLVRVSNGMVIILGLTLLAYGGYLSSICKPLNTVAEAALGLGVVDLALGLVAIACYRSLFALRLYGLSMTFLVIAEFVVAILFFTNSPTVSSFSTCDSDQALNFAKTKNAVSWIILAVAIFQSISLVFVFFQVCSVDKVRDFCCAPCAPTGRGVGSALLSATFQPYTALHASQSTLSLTPAPLQPFDENQYQEESHLSSDKYGALSDEGVPTANERYKQKHVSLAPPPSVLGFPLL